MRSIPQLTRFTTNHSQFLLLQARTDLTSTTAADDLSKGRYIGRTLYRSYLAREPFIVLQMSALVIDLSMSDLSLWSFMCGPFGFRCQMTPI